jgi:hypothetical protein
VAGLHSVQKALVELEDMPEVSAHPMRRKRWGHHLISEIVDLLERRHCLAQGGDVLLD